LQIVQQNKKSYLVSAKGKYFSINIKVKYIIFEHLIYTNANLGSFIFDGEKREQEEVGFKQIFNIQMIIFAKVFFFIKIQIYVCLCVYIYYSHFKIIIDKNV
jgi:hypothetical protein